MKPRIMWTVALSEGDGWTFDGANLASTRRDAIGDFEAGGWNWNDYLRAFKAGDARVVKVAVLPAADYAALVAENKHLHAKVAELIDEAGDAKTARP